MKKFTFTVLAIGSLGIFSCGGGTEKPKDADTSMESASETAASTAVTSISITSGDDMKYSETEFTVPVGKEVTISLHNMGKMAKDVMGHNMVVLKPGSDVKAYAAGAVSAKAEDYEPKAQADQVLGSTKLLGPDEKGEIKITFTEPGVYPFLCSFPGHEGTMNGTITVE